MNELFLIGEVAKLFHMSVKTLYYYDSIGILKPAFIDAGNGYRYYGPEQFERLNTIRYLRALGMPLSAIKEHLEQRSLDKILDSLEKQRQITTDKIRELFLIQEKIENRITQIKDATDGQPFDQIICKQLPVRKCIVLKQEFASHDNLEVPIRYLENAAQIESTIFLGKIGLCLDKNQFLSGNFQKYNMLFSLLENEEVSADCIGIFPAGTYLSLRFVGTHIEAPKYYQQLLSWVQQNRYAVLSDGIEITLIDQGLTKQKEKYVTEIQILVQ